MVIRTLKHFYQHLFLIITIIFISKCWCANVEHPFKISLTISSKLHRLEIAWFNLKPAEGVILITNFEPIEEFRQISDDLPTTPQIPFAPATSTALLQVGNNITTDDYSSNLGLNVTIDEAAPTTALKWIYGASNQSVLYFVEPKEVKGWHTTTIVFDMNLSKNISISTKCYGYWATYLNGYGVRTESTCIRAHATWMNDMRSHIGDFKFRNLFLLGSHDSGSYRENFDPLQYDTLVTKYSLTQDEDVLGQLMHGVRYLDIRVGFYRASKPQYWVNHGISRQQPLINILNHLRDFVTDTNEIVIFDLQEFPIGFARDYDTHRNLVQYIISVIGDLMVHPELTWDTTLNDIWKSKRNIIVSYDIIHVVNDFPSQIWHSCQQRWGNVQTISDLKLHLSPSGRQYIFMTSRPIADMAELTPNTWDVITDRFGGLRKMADQVNRQISEWYSEEWGPTTNIVAVDFIRGTTLMDSSLYWNSKKEIINL